MTGTIDSRETGFATPPVGAILEVRYPAGEIGYAIWTGLTWRPRYVAMVPTAWRRRAAPGEAPGPWVEMTPARDGR